MTIVLLDENSQAVDVDQSGEIVVESDYLAIGYWNDTDRTNAVFHTDIARDIRRYYTGDIGRLKADGCLEYLGRKNFQAKIRGHLIDYAEIEAALMSLRDITEAVVLAQEDQAGEQRLIAYLVSSGHPAPTATFLRNELAQRLVEYMIPSLYIFMNARSASQCE